MLDPDKVLPTIVVQPLTGNVSIAFATLSILEAQRDADLVVLLRDYVPRERVKALVDAARAVLKGLAFRQIEWIDTVLLAEALAQPGVEP